MKPYVLPWEVNNREGSVFLKPGRVRAADAVLAGMSLCCSGSLLWSPGQPH